MSRLTRRRALKSALLGGALASCARAPEMTPYTSPQAGPGGVFAHGVASGDPDATSVVIWTRASVQSDAPVTIVWETAADEAFTEMRGKGEATTSAAADWTVKVLLRDLAPGETLFYRFRLGDVYSPIGRTKTLPTGAVERARFAVMSCSNYPFGFFNVYDLAARQTDIDAVIHLGDYVYEYGRDGYGGETGAELGRNHDPAHEAVTLADYRARHAQYKADPCCQALHGAHPLIAIWDDHETSNNSWKDGAENHDPESEGEWSARKRAALQAYYEWMPVREPEPGGLREALFRSYSFGDLLTLAALETRLMARAKQFEYPEVVPTLKSPEDVEAFRENVLWDPSREMLGAAQAEFIENALRNSVEAGQPWRVIANQIIMAEVIAPDLNPHVTDEDIAALEREWPPARSFVESSALGLPLNFDAWDGYPAAREKFYEAAEDAGAAGMIVVTGDTHTWWANDLKRSDGAHMGVELGTHSVTSRSPYRKEFLGGKGAEYALLTNRENKAVRYISGEDHGFILLDIGRNEATARFMAVDNILSPEYNAFEKAAFKIRRGERGAKFAGVEGVSLKEKVLF